MAESMVAFEVLCQPSIAPNPGEEPFDDQRRGFTAKPVGIFAHDFDGDQRGRGDLLAGISAVGEDPLDENRLVGNWWAGGEDDVRPAGELAKGYSSLNFSGVGQNYPAIQDIFKYVVDKGKSLVESKSKVGENLYNRGVMNAVLIAEAIRTAQRLTGKKQVTGEDVRRGLETLNISDARWTELGLPGSAAPIHFSCADHNGHNGIYLVEWDGNKWTKAPGWIEPIKDKVLPLIESAATNYVSANAGWPKRTEACDKSS